MIKEKKNIEAFLRVTCRVYPSDVFYISKDKTYQDFTHLHTHNSITIFFKKLHPQMGKCFYRVTHEPSIFHLN